MGDDPTLLAHLLVTAAAHPRQPALRCGDEALTYDELRARISLAAGRLRSLGVVEGDRVLLCAENTLSTPVLYFAIHALGAVAAPLPSDTPAAMLGWLVRDAEARLLAVAQDVPPVSCPVASATALTAAGPAADEPIVPTCHSGAIADLLYTTGTTGRKKGVVLTHAAILTSARNITAFVGNRPGDVEVVPLPLGHSFGLGRLRCLAFSGHTLVLEPSVGNGAAVVRRILDTKATGLAMTPAGFEILRRITREALGAAKDHLRYIEIGSAAMRPDTRQWLARLLPHTRICHHYGLTEASRAAFTEYHSDAHKAGSAGRAAPGVEIVICDEAGRPVGANEVGEVVVRGGMVMREYWRQPQLTRETFCAEGLKTGDMGCLDADGYLFLLGRRSDMINVGGRKVSPDEIEDLLRQLDGVRDAGCVGEPDDLLGERVKAYLVADRDVGRAEVAAFLRSRVEEFKIPQTVEMIALIPRTDSGKVQRRKLRNPEETPWTPGA